MNALELLENDHHRVDQLFETYASTQVLAQKEELAQQLIEALSVHASVEDRCVYGPASERGPVLYAQVLQGHETHDLVKTTRLRLEGLLATPSAAAHREQKLDAVVKVLAAVVRHHVTEEEQAFVPELQRVMGDAELEAMGRRLVEATTTAPRFPPLPHPIGALAQRVDQLVELARDILGTATEALRGI